MGIWAALAIICFICAFFCPLFPKIIGLAFGSMNLLIILSSTIVYFQDLLINNKTKIDEEDELSMQKTETK